MSASQVILHVGLVKAASTKLQRSLFAHHPEVTFLGKPHEPRLKELIEHACWADFVDYDEERLRNYFEEQIAPLTANGDRPVVVSNEQLTQTERMTRTMVAERIRVLFGDCRIIVVIRNQLTWLESMYFWQLGKGHIGVPFELFALLNMRGGIGRFVDYASLTKSYADVFGDENVGVFLFEELTANPQTFARQVCRFAGIDEPAGAETMNETREMQRMSQIQYLRVKYGIAPHARLSRFVPAPINALVQKIGGSPKRANMSAELVRRLEDFYGESNQKLADKYDLPLDEYGYPL